MNHTLTTDQLSRIFGERIGQQILRPDGKTILKVEGLVRELIIFFEGGKITYGSLLHNKLLLTPLEKISDEDAIQCCKLFNPTSFYSDKKWYVERFTKEQAGIAGVRVKSKKSYHYFEILTDGTIEIMDEETGDSPVGVNPSQIFALEFIKQQGYDVPGFYGLSHPDNGRTLIDMGIAIDKETFK